MYAEIATWGYILVIGCFFLGLTNRNGFFWMLSGGLMLLLAAIVIGEGIQIVSGINIATGQFNYHTLTVGNDFFLQFISYLSVPFGLGLVLFGANTIRG